MSANFDADAHGGNVVVFTGTAEPAPDAPPVTAHSSYLAKYAAAIERIGTDAEKFAETYSVPLRMRITKVRGF